MSNSFWAVFQNPVFFIGVKAWLSAQFIKFCLQLLFDRHNIKNLGDFLYTIIWKTGGMPSSHGALVMSLCTAIGLYEGFNNNLFVLSVFISFIVLRDAVGVRYSTGIQARILNYISDQLYKKFRIHKHIVKEVKGHTLKEIGVGAILGIFIALSNYYW